MGQNFIYFYETKYCWTKLTYILHGDLDNSIVFFTVSLLESKTPT